MVTVKDNRCDYYRGVGIIRGCLTSMYVYLCVSVCGILALKCMAVDAVFFIRKFLVVMDMFG